jgi:hypothetical protein
MPAPFEIDFRDALNARQTASAATPFPVTATPGGTAGAPSASAVMAVQGFGFTSSVSVTRPSNTTAYTAGDCVGIADSGTPANAGSAILAFLLAGPAGGEIYLTDVDLRIHLSAVPSGMTTFRLHLYDAAPDAILDNAAWDLSSSGDRGKYLGYVDLVQPADLGSTLYSQNPAINKRLKLAAASTTLYGVLQTTGAYTPASGTVYVPALKTVAV